jgi:hypothetical protein
MCVNLLPQLIYQLQKLYPIVRRSEGGVCTIRSLPLPDIDMASYEEEAISTALGFTCHYLLLFSKYLEVPLRYTIVLQGSRCLVRDDASGAPAEFPLYWKGVEMYKFDIGIVLLRRNIVQLLLSENIFVDLSSLKPVPILECLIKLKNKILMLD